MSKETPAIAAAFRGAALRRTAQRYAVMDFLVRHLVHATADEIFHAINRRDVRASRATVYNSLNALLRAGLVREVAGDGNAARFDANLKRHYHFICDGCGAIEDVPWFEVPESALRDWLAGRQVRNCEIVVRGTCQSCSSLEGER